MTLHTDEPPTEAIPVVPEEEVDDYDDFLDEDFTKPSRRSRVTVALFALLLVAMGFFGGVFVERTWGTPNVTQRTGPAAASTPRAGAAGPLGRL